MPPDAVQKYHRLRLLVIASWLFYVLGRRQLELEITENKSNWRSGRDLKSVNNKSSASVTSQRGLIEMSESRQWFGGRFLSIQRDELSKSEGIMHIVIIIIMHIRILRIDNFIKSLL